MIIIAEEDSVNVQISNVYYIKSFYYIKL